METVESISVYINYQQHQLLTSVKNKARRQGGMWKADFEQELVQSRLWYDGEERIEEIVAVVSDKNGKIDDNKIQQLCDLAEQNIINEVVGDPSHCENLTLNNSLVAKALQIGRV